MERNNEGQREEQTGEKRKLLEMRESEKEPFLTPRKKKEIRDWVVAFVGALLVVLLVRSFLFTLIRVEGPSMSDTLLDGDRLFVSVLDVRLNGPDRFDVVILHYPNKKYQYVKRVIGVPGDTLEVRSGKLYINGTLYEEPYLTAERVTGFSKASSDFTVTLGDDEYFVMGDNRDNSNDSRSVGVISRDQFVGKVRCILWPISRWDIIEGAEVYNQ